jgi:DNA-3-methyladenine glycosylase II
MTEDALAQGLDFIRKADADFARALSVISPLPSRDKPAGFEHLCKIIIEQQVSLASAAAIWGRLSAAVQPFTPTQILEFEEEALRGLGLSRQKALYCQALATEIAEKRLDLDGLEHMNDQDAIAALTTVKGIGRWTAEIYLISCLARQDIWPAGDIALQVALQHLKNLPERPNLAEMDHHSLPLQPYRTIAARILWRYYSDIVKPPTRAPKEP